MGTPSPPSTEDSTTWDPWSSTSPSALLLRPDTTLPEVPSLLRRLRTRRRELSSSTSTTKSDSDPEIFWLIGNQDILELEVLSCIQKGFSSQNSVFFLNKSLKKTKKKKKKKKYSALI